VTAAAERRHDGVRSGTATRRRKQRRALARFLRAKRSQVAPADVGLPDRIEVPAS
jgi:hypothetical protein